MKVTILQPSYIPWRGYFHQIFKSDLFIFYDDVQYDKRGWRNRNRIKTMHGSKWLTIPVLASNVQIDKTPINRIRIDWGQKWNQKHWLTIQHTYGKTPYFKTYEKDIFFFYSKHYEYLADFTIDYTIHVCEWLGIQNTRFLKSSDLKGITGNKTNRLIQILKQVGATHYISGPSAKNYIDENSFKESGIRIEYMNYNYSPYPQLYPPFDPQVSILDLIFMTGPDAINHILDLNGKKQ